jgi:predicted esterase
MPPIVTDPTTHLVETPTHGRVLVERSPASRPDLLLVGFHGYGENADRHMEELRRIPGADRWTRVAVQGLHRFYNPKTQDVVASWMTRQDREQAIADNVEYVDRVMAMVVREVGTPARLVYAGFSQGVAMAYRAAVCGAMRASGVIALAGDLPPDTRESSMQCPPVLIGRGTNDTWYTDEKLRADVDYLRSIGVRVEEEIFGGGHEWADPFRSAAAQFLRSLAGAGT